MPSSTLITATIRQVRQSNKNLVEKARALNQDVGPTFDSNDMPHAPFNGYIWGDRVYGGGEFLPYVDTTSVKVKFMGTPEVVEALQAEDLALNASHGKVWDAQGQQVCYIYIDVNKDEAKALDAVIPEYDNDTKPIVLVSEVGERDGSKTWKFSAAKYAANLAYSYRTRVLEVLDIAIAKMEAQGVTGVCFKPKKKGSIETVLVSDFDGQAVRYLHISELDIVFYPGRP